MARRTVSFWARKPILTRVSFRRSSGERVSFAARVPKTKFVKFKTRR